MTLSVAPERLGRALEYIQELHDPGFTLSYDTALRILQRTHALVEGKRDPDFHAYLRVAASQEQELGVEHAVFYRKVINAYWRFAPAKQEA